MVAAAVGQKCSALFRPRNRRHTTAVHLVAAGVNVTVIRSWLGHTHLDTTYQYAQVGLKTKRKALEQADPNFAALVTPVPNVAPFEPSEHELQRKLGGARAADLV